jgi:sugar lactone lactonase YvrE
MFGGPDLRTLFFTSAWESLAETAAQAPPGAGNLYALDAGVAGLERPLFQM